MKEDYDVVLADRFTDSSFDTQISLDVQVMQSTGWLLKSQKHCGLN